MWPNPQFSADLITFTEEILNGKFHLLCSTCIFSSNNAVAHNWAEKKTKKPHHKLFTQTTSKIMFSEKKNVGM